MIDLIVSVYTETEMLITVSPYSIDGMSDITAETVPGFVAQYEARGSNSWERRVYAEGRLRQDLQHYTEYYIASHTVTDSVVQLTVVLQDHLGTGNFERATEVRETNVTVGQS